MLRCTLLASAGAMALTGAALAADLPSRAPPPVFLPPAQVYSWTGLYVGINAGYHWGGSTSQFTTTDTDGDAVGGGLGAAQDFGLIPTTGAAGASGFIGGGGFGYNYQINSFVLGLEADFDGATGSGNSSALLTTSALGFFIPPTLTQSQQRLDWLGTLRGRIGWTPIDRLLIYGTGGLAFGQSTASFSVVNTLGFFPPLSAFASSSTSVGWTAGGGLEYALPDNWSNWSVKVEYLYYDLGHTTGTVSYQNIDITGASEFSTLSSHTRHNGNIVRAGLNYKFNWWAPAPIVAKY
ncbi:MAG: outer membrane protein [Methylocella sp.]